jgi:hypothetical protein
LDRRRLRVECFQLVNAESAAAGKFLAASGLRIRRQVAERIGRGERI